MSNQQTILLFLEKHAGVNITARWPGSPDPSDWRNIRRVCSCGNVIGREDYPESRPGKTVSYPLGGYAFDEPHRLHIAEELAQYIPAVSIDLS